MAGEPQKIPSVQLAIDASGGKQEALAERLGCAQQTVSKLLLGEIAIDADWAVRLHRASGIPVAEFCPELASVLAS